MHRLSFLFAAGLLALVPARADNALPEGRCAVAADEAAIETIIADWLNGYNSGDAAKVAHLYTDHATYLTQHYVSGIVQGRKAIQAYVQLGADAHYHIDSIRILASDCAGDYAHAITRYDATNAGQKTFGVNLVVLRKTDGRWQIVAHEAAVPDVAAAVQHLDIK